MKTNIIKGTMITKQIGNCTLINSDCLEVLKDWSYDRVSAVVTDPPYGLSFMGKEWDHGVPGIPFWEAIKSVCYSGSPLFAFGGTRTFHRLAVAIEDAGWEIMDTLSWLYGSGFPKSYDISKGIDKQAGTERTEFIDNPERRYQRGSKIEKRNSYGEYSNFDSYTKIGLPATDQAKEWNGYKSAFKPSYEPILFAYANKGNYVDKALNEGVSGLNIDAGRIPTRDDLSGGIMGGIFGNGKKAIGSGDKGRYTAKTSPNERDGRKHPTIKPIAIMRYLVKLATYPRTNLILDPFMGSGSTIASCMLENVPAVGVEKDPDNFKEAVEWLTKFHNKLHRDGEAYGHIPKWLQTDKVETPKSRTEQIELFG